MNAARGESDRDRIAVQAAILIETGRATRISEAIRSAADALGISDGPMPSHAAVRKHAQAMAMQAMGDADYRESRTDILRVAEEMLTVMEQAGCDSLLVGRAAAGHLDADVRLHIRVYADAPVGELAQHLVDFGYEEPQFDTVDTAYGRMNRMMLMEQGVPVIIMRCPLKMNVPRTADAFTGKPKPSATAADLRRRIDAV